ncbi:MAG: 3-hydroxyacyl-CoA dehydrogenase NAD-binding domain-containing protein [Actinomycetota bacterium]|nr:3-hydroxyacyl-CoA dehydrogenase NAD-binding domain-containing protein [Actinomycetota bacterium]
MGVAQRFAQSGHEVVLVDLSDTALENAKRSLHDGIRLSRLFRVRDSDPDPDEILRRVSYATDYSCLSDVEFLVENVSEDWPRKRDAYRGLDRACQPDCIFAANTSAIPITRIAGVTTRAPRVIGLHFMNPVPLKPFVEVIPGFHTSPATVAAAQGLLATMGMDSVTVRDSPGFVSNRVLMLTVNEAIFLVHEDVAAPEDVDRLFRSAFGHKMGPLETADLIGLDTILNSIEVLYDCFNDSKYRPCPLLRQMVDAGMHGRKTGKGFYSYDSATPAPLSAGRRETA